MRIALTVAILLTVSAAASACGNPLLWKMLFDKVPEAKSVYEAELTARAMGLVKARVYAAEIGQTYHTWSKDWLMTLAMERQSAITEVLEPGQSVTILLADEVAALRFTESEDSEFIPASNLDAIDNFDLITTINALNSAWRHGLSYEKMNALGLILHMESASNPDPAVLF